MPDVTDWMQASAAVVGAGIAVAAAWYARKQIEGGLKTSRESVAMEAYRSYLSLCIEYPQMSSSDMYLKLTNRKNFVGIMEELSEASERYLWFVSNLLDTGEQIVEHVDGREQWRALILQQVKYHAPALVEAWPDWKYAYGDIMCGIVVEAVGDVRPLQQLQKTSLRPSPLSQTPIK